MLKVLRGSAGIAIAMAVMNLGTYAFQMVAARLLIVGLAFASLVGIIAFIQSSGHKATTDRMLRPDGRIGSEFR